MLRFYHFVFIFISKYLFVNKHDYICEVLKEFWSDANTIASFLDRLS